MTQLEECLEQKQKLTTRLQDYKTKLVEAKTSQERAEYKAKITVYRAALRDLQVQIDYLDPPKERSARKAQKKRLDVGALTFDWFERNNEVWSDIDGHSWAQIQDRDYVELGTDMQQLQHWLSEGSQRLTKRQRLYIDAYYNQGLSLQMIAEMYNVDKSTVSKVIKNGLSRMQDWIEAKKLIESCITDKTSFDWAQYLSKVPVLTDRQRQLMLLVLSGFPRTQEEMAEKLDLKQTTISRTLANAKNTILDLKVRGGNPVSRPKIDNWDQADKFQLALQTNMPLYFYYRYCFRGQYIGGVSRYNYELSCRREAGVSAEKTAEEFGLKPKTVRSAYSKLKRQSIKVGHLPIPKDGSIGARLDPETYVKLQRLVTSYADT